MRLEFGPPRVSPKLALPTDRVGESRLTTTTLPALLTRKCEWPVKTPATLSTVRLPPTSLASALVRVRPGTKVPQLNGPVGGAPPKSWNCRCTPPTIAETKLPGVTRLPFNPLPCTALHCVVS